ncbi:polymorphic toxin-type HINT domain-containing protein, partial [Micromonospora fulviviridis]
NSSNDPPPNPSRPRPQPPDQDFSSTSLDYCSIAYTGETTRTDTYDYDNAGNTITRTVNGNTQTLTWDAEGHLATTTGNSQDTSYVYDPAGNRLIRHDPDGTTLYLGATELRLTNTGQIDGTRYYQHGDSTVAVRAITGLTWLVADHHSTNQLAINPADLTVSRRRSMPFGEPRGTQPTDWPGDKGFVNGTQDPTGLTHLGAREYDPLIGRFASADPLIDTADPQQWNAYSYANNTPVTASDPDGLMIINDGGGGKYVPPAPSKPKKKSFWSQIGSGIASGFKRAVVDSFKSVVARIVDSWKSVFRNAKSVSQGKMTVTAALADAGKTFVKNYASSVTSLVMGPVNVYKGYGDTWKNLAKGDYEAAASSWTESSIGAVSIAAGARAGFKGKPSCHSFASSTAVLLADGTHRAISEVKVGDLVLAADTETGDTPRKPVTDLHKNEDHDLTDLTVLAEGGESKTLHTTQHHPFWSKNRNGWVDAAELRPGERLQTTSGESAVVAEVHNFISAETMFDLTVADLHTYYVLAGGAPVLVHNCGGYFKGHDESCTCEGIGGVTPERAPVEAPGEVPGLTGHALQRLQQRGVSVDEARAALSKDPFSYYHDGQWKSGYYDPRSKVFIAKTIDGNINTVMTGVDKAYINRLRGGR